MALKRFKLDVAGSNNATLIQAGSVKVLNIFVNNAAASERWVRLYDKATTPTGGTDVPVIVINIPASSSKEIALKIEIEFLLGLGIGITGAAAYNDNTSVTAHDVQIYIGYDDLR